MAKTILFVDDEPLVLMGLQRLFRPLRFEWEMQFVLSGAAALEAMDRQSFDVVVTDMRMPSMTGAELLEEVRRHHPRTLRFVLSGQSDSASMLRAVSAAHQYLAKPCDPDELKQVLTRTFALREVLEDARLKEVVSQLASLPSIPALYVELMDLIESPQSSVDKIAAIVERDLGMTSKVLQIANSAVLGLRCQVSSAAQAVSLLGVDAIKALVLSCGVFSQMQVSPEMDGPEALKRLWEHSLLAARLSRDVARMAGAERRGVDDAFTSGLLHDIGKLILMTQLPAQWKKITRTAQKRQQTLSQAEYEVMGCGHAEIGACLLGTWSLPTSLVEAVAWHHRPSESPRSQLCPLVFLHIADSLAGDATSPWEFGTTQLDEAFLQRCGATHYQEWINACNTPA